MSDRAEDKKNKIICTFCDEEHIKNPAFEGQGTHIGNSQNLAKVLMKEYYGNQPQRNHPLSMPKGIGSCAQAHHLICCESMDDDDWAEICSNYGYNINCKENGIFLPADMGIACQLYIPLHRGNHSATETDESVIYVEAVRNNLETIKKEALKKKNEFCKGQRDIISEFKQKSKKIWSKVEKFVWTLTYDGRDYSGGPRGCLGEKSLRKKREVDKADAKCTLGRKHNLIIEGTYYIEQSN